MGGGRGGGGESRRLEWGLLLGDVFRWYDAVLGRREGGCGLGAGETGPVRSGGVGGRGSSGDLTVVGWMGYGAVFGRMRSGGGGWAGHAHATKHAKEVVGRGTGGAVGGRAVVDGA